MFAMRTIRMRPLSVLGLVLGLSLGLGAASPLARARLTRKARRARPPGPTKAACSA
jgi:hypothetical protein